MDASVECTHCQVVMTSWSAPGSPIRYYQCPFCQRTLSSLYGEVFRRRAGARVVEPPRAAPPPGIPMATQEEVRWARVKATAARWFARLEADQQRCATPGEPALHAGDDSTRASAGRGADHVEAVEVAPAGAGRRA
jgi:hypothetical protein